MSELNFEPQLRALFSQPAAFPDAQDFQQRIRQKLRRRRGVRVAVLGASGGLAGVVSVHALLASDLLGQFHQAVALLLKATDWPCIYCAIAILLLLALVLATNLDDDCSLYSTM